jgi:amidophosphoribosyltransferase
MCGVIAVIGPKSEAYQNKVATDVFRGLLTLQHRGQDAAGIISYSSVSGKFYQKKDLGLVGQVFNSFELTKLMGNMGLGHTRYATIGSDDREDIQPLVSGFPYGIAMCHNGNLVNYFSLARKFQTENNLRLLTNNDLEIFLQSWIQEILKSGSATNGSHQFKFSQAVSAAKRILDQTSGAYALLGMVAEEGIFGLRDPHGIRPLCLGKKETEEGVYYCLSSETVAFNFLGYEYVRDIEPGELIFIDKNSNVQSIVLKNKEFKSPCMFEWVYFSGAESSLENRSVYSARLDLGRVLANKARKLIESNRISPDVVMPVPDTSRTSAISVSECLGLPYREGLIKYRYSHRSFILNTQEKRQQAVELKLSPVKSEIEGKNILLIDDSIVRGTTSKQIVGLLKKYGAKTITLGVTCPPIRYPCFYGIDFPDEEELIANNKSIREIAEWVGVNEVIYLEEEDLIQALKIKNLCMSCLNQNYPTSIEDAEEFKRRRRKNDEAGALQ